MVYLSSLVSRLALLVMGARLAHAIAITTPTVVDIWRQVQLLTSRGRRPADHEAMNYSQSATATNDITWSLLPLTTPAPATQYFDIYIRNGIGSMYTPSLNLSIATNVDATTKLSFAVTDAMKFIPGPGYQLFFSDPTNAATVYCDSDVFSIGSMTVRGTIASSATSTALSSTVSVPEASSTPSISSTYTLVSSTTSPSLNTTTSSSSNSSVTAISTTRSRIAAATAIGGPADQGFNLVHKSAAAVLRRAARVGELELAAAAAVAGVMLLLL
ncbi:hypothetical protein JCM1840_007143 [Sporobolomyces johnsonii]